MRVRKELRTYRKWPFPCVPYLKMWCLVICELHRMLSNITVLRWTWALGSEPRISGPRDASTRPRTRNRTRTHHQLVRFASRLLIFVSLCIASASSVFPHHPSPSDRRLSSNKHSRITPARRPSCEHASPRAGCSPVLYCCPPSYRAADLSNLEVVQNWMGAQPKKKKSPS